MSLDERAHHHRTERFTSAGREARFAPDPHDLIGPTVEESTVPLLFSADGEGDAIPLAEEVGPSYSAIPVEGPRGRPEVEDSPHDVAVRTRSLLHGAVASRGWAIGLTVVVAALVAGVAAAAVVLEREDADPRVMVAGSSIERDEPEGAASEWSYVQVSTEVATTEMIGRPIAISSLSPEGVTSLRHQVTHDSGLIQIFDVTTPAPGGSVPGAEEVAGLTFPEQRATVVGPPIETPLGIAHDYWAMVGTDRVEGRVVLTAREAIRMAVRTPADGDAVASGEALQHQVAALAPAPAQPR